MIRQLLQKRSWSFIVVSRNAIDAFFIVDFDRTLARTDELRLLFRRILLQETPVTEEQMTHGEMSHANSFDVATYVREVLGKTMQSSEIETLLQGVRRLFIEEAKQHYVSLLEPYAAELLGDLEDDQRPFGILTTGGQEWQQLKIEATRLDKVPHLIIETSRKSDLLTSWRHGDGFLLPDALSGMASCVAKTIVFLDDKPISFEGIPDGVLGIWVLPVASAKADDIVKLEVPEGVIHARGLKEARDVLIARGIL